ncbi:hypothetical protein SNEBB_008232 [Seison nebaliae]|nr:hypothetical protein SNEBB_008232 [Seison nebaliae]
MEDYELFERGHHNLLFESTNYSIDSFAYFRNKLYFACQNDVINYKLEEGKIEMMNRYQNVLKKKVTQMMIAEELAQILVVTNDYLLTCHTFSNFTQSPITVIKDVKFIDLDTDDNRNTYLLIANKRNYSIQLFKWTGQDFFQQTALSLPGAIKSAKLCGKSVYVYVDREGYYQIDIQSGAAQQLYGSNGNVPPIIETIKLQNTERDRSMRLCILQLSKDSVTTKSKESSSVGLIFDENKTLLTDIDNQMTWSQNPTKLIFLHPFVIGISREKVQIKRLYGLLKMLDKFEYGQLDVKHIQNVDVYAFVRRSKSEMKQLIPIKHVTVDEINQSIFVAGDHRMISIQKKTSHQIQQYLKSKREYETLRELIEEDLHIDELEKKDHFFTLNNLTANSHFGNGNYGAAFRLFKEVRTDPTHILHLRPELLPSSIKMENEILEHLSIMVIESIRDDNRRNDERMIKRIQNDETLEEMTNFLKFHRSELLKKMETIQNDFDPEFNPLLKEQKPVDSARICLILIDTAMMKIFIGTKEFGKFIDHPKNSVPINEVEMVIGFQENEWEEMDWKNLASFYFNKKSYGKCFDLLRKRLKTNVNETILEYLSRIDDKHIDILFEQSIQLIRRNNNIIYDLFPLNSPKCLAAIHTEEIIKFIERTIPNELRDYLLHLKENWKELSMENCRLINGKLILTLFGILLEFIQMKNVSLSEKQVNNYTNQLMTIITNDDEEYDGKEIIHQLNVHPITSVMTKIDISPSIITTCHYLILVKVHVYGQLHLHNDSLDLLITQLNDENALHEYLDRHCHSSTIENLTMALVKCLLKEKKEEMLVKVLDNRMIYWMDKSMDNCQEKIGKIKEILNLIKKSQLNVSLRKTKNFIISSLGLIEKNLKELYLQKTLLQTQQLSLEEKRIAAESEVFILRENTTCAICMRRIRINECAFIKYRNKNSVVHFGCHKEN